MDTTAIKQEIDDNIKPNGVGAITGQVLNETLNDIVDETTPEFYSEDGATNSVSINTDYEVDIHGGEKVELSTAGWHLKLSEEEGVVLRLGNAVNLRFDSDGFHYVVGELYKIDFELYNGFRVELNDGDPVVLQYDIYNGLQVMGGLRVGTITLDGVDLSETLGDLQRQIDELKNQ